MLPLALAPMDTERIPAACEPTELMVVQVKVSVAPPVVLENSTASMDWNRVLNQISCTDNAPALDTRSVSVPVPPMMDSVNSLPRSFAVMM